MTTGIKAWLDSSREEVEHKPAMALIDREELERLRAELDATRKAFMKMRSAADGYSNFCDESAWRRGEREYDEAEAMYRGTRK